MIKPNAYAVGLGYARALSDKFSVGGNVKYVRQDLGTGATQATYIGSAGSYTDATTIGNKNALDVIERVKQTSEELRPTFPPGVELKVAYDSD